MRTLSLSLSRVDWHVARHGGVQYCAASRVKRSTREQHGVVNGTRLYPQQGRKGVARRYTRQGEFLPTSPAAFCGTVRSKSSILASERGSERRGKGQSRRGGIDYVGRFQEALPSAGCIVFFARVVPCPCPVVYVQICDLFVSIGTELPPRPAPSPPPIEKVYPTCFHMTAGFHTVKGGDGGREGRDRDGGGGDGGDGDDDDDAAVAAENGRARVATGAVMGRGEPRRGGDGRERGPGSGGETREICGAVLSPSDIEELLRDDARMSRK